MKNIQIETKGTKVIITLDTTKDFGRSASGKTTIVASTCGNISVPGTDITIGVNAYKR
jgi:hypothetical protein